MKLDYAESVVVCDDAAVSSGLNGVFEVGLTLARLYHHRSGSQVAAQCGLPRHQSRKCVLLFSQSYSLLVSVVSFQVD